VSEETGDQRPSGDDVRPATDLDALTDEVLPALIARLRASRLGELEVASAGWRVRLRRDTTPRRSAPGPAGAGDGEVANESLASVARSPAVGYFKPAANLAVGVSVQAGDPLGSVDVLGIVQEVTAPSDGIISRVLAEGGQAVEYGQALADVDPLEADFGPDTAVAG
jgi:acetyl-CoA carboxylase biotin carboxyl carrier protein